MGVAPGRKGKRKRTWFFFEKEPKNVCVLADAGGKDWRDEQNSLLISKKESFLGLACDRSECAHRTCHPMESSMTGPVVYAAMLRSFAC
jgi:hypothetical protein